jgi:hypothetical protein
VSRVKCVVGFELYFSLTVVFFLLFLFLFSQTQFFLCSMKGTSCVVFCLPFFGALGVVLGAVATWPVDSLWFHSLTVVGLVVLTLCLLISSSMYALVGFRFSFIPQIFGVLFFGLFAATNYFVAPPSWFIPITVISTLAALAAFMNVFIAVSNVGSRCLQQGGVRVSLPKIYIAWGVISLVGAVFFGVSIWAKVFDWRTMQVGNWINYLLALRAQIFFLYFCFVMLVPVMNLCAPVFDDQLIALHVTGMSAAAIFCLIGPAVYWLIESFSAPQDAQTMMLTITYVRIFLLFNCFVLKKKTFLFQVHWSFVVLHCLSWISNCVNATISCCSKCTSCTRSHSRSQHTSHIHCYSARSSSSPS